MTDNGLNCRNTSAKRSQATHGDSFGPSLPSENQDVLARNGTTAGSNSVIEFMLGSMIHLMTPGPFTSV